MKKHNIQKITGALALTGLLALAPLASAQQRALLSGTTDGVQWTVYGPGNLSNLAQNEKTIEISAHPQATVLGTRYDAGGRTAILAFRVSAPLQTVFDFHDQQLTAQGFKRVASSVGQNLAEARYTRGGEEVRFRLNGESNNSYRAFLDLGNLNMAMGSVSQANNAQAATPATATAATTPATTTAAAQNNPVVQAQDMAGVTYVLYGPNNNLTSLNNNPGTVSFSVPQGATITNTNVNSNGDLSAQVTSGLTLQQMMGFYDKQFTQQGFTLVNPTDTGAGGDNALTYIYERGNNSRVSFSVEKEDNYRLVWDFQDAVSGNLGNNVAAASPTAATPFTPLYGYNPAGGVGYDFYGPGNLAGVTPTANRISFVAPAGSQVTDVSNQGEDVFLTVQTANTLQQLQANYDQQLRQQGYQRVGDMTMQGNMAKATYQRSAGAGQRIIWSAEPTGAANTYRVVFNFQNTGS